MANESTSILPRSMAYVRAVSLAKEWVSAKSALQIFGKNPARQALVNTAYAAFIAHMDNNEQLYAVQDSIIIAAEA